MKRLLLALAATIACAAIWPPDSKACDTKLSTNTKITQKVRVETPPPPVVKERVRIHQDIRLSVPPPVVVQPQIVERVTVPAAPRIVERIVEQPAIVQERIVERQVPTTIRERVIERDVPAVTTEAVTTEAVARCGLFSRFREMLHARSRRCASTSAVSGSSLALLYAAGLYDPPATAAPSPTLAPPPSLAPSAVPKAPAPPPAPDPNCK